MKKTLLLLVAMIISVASFAQVTTSSISGQVTDTNGEALIGATVIAVHTPSGTQYGAVANNDGYYYINGTRSGGPYSIEVSYVGCQTQIFENVNIPLGENYSQNAKLKDSQNIDAVYVTSSAAERFDNSKTGAATNITTTDIAAMPSVSRSITDIIRLSPYSNGTSFAGGDGRSSNFTVDGANLNNNFGLSSALPGGGTPISIDALEEIQVVISPFDVRQTNFIGGGINAVTKSGTNTFSGSAYTYFYNENMRGNTVDGTDLGDRATDGRQTYGFTFGGPIVKDKLFFFTNFEYELRP
ncbi:MAG: TonB-dependent receptor, partial [Rikenellaceae bacterium]